MNEPDTEIVHAFIAGVVIGAILLAGIHTFGLAIGVGDSMDTTIQSPAIMSTHPVDDLTEVENGDIIGYETVQGEYVAHRVVGFSDTSRCGDDTNTTYVITSPDNPAYDNRVDYVRADNVVLEVEWWVSVNPLAYL